jgi:hypothetical protein
MTEALKDAEGPTAVALKFFIEYNNTCEDGQHLTMCST